MRTYMRACVLGACLIATLLTRRVLACTPPTVEFEGGMQKLPANSSMWWTSWTQYNHFAAEGWAKRDGVLVTTSAGFAWAPTPLGVYAVPAQGLSYEAKWWSDGTKQVTVVVLHTYLGYTYKDVDDSTHTF